MCKALMTFFGLCYLSTLSAGIQADIRTFVFYQNEKPYVEITFVIPTDQLVHEYAPDSSFRTSVNVLVTLSEGSRIFKADKFTLHSPLLKENKPVLHVLRWPMSYGNFILQTEIQDAMAEGHALTLVDSLNISQLPSSLVMSDIQLFSVVTKDYQGSQAISKNGFVYEPLPWNNLGRQFNFLHFYLETYGMQSLSDPDFVLQFQLLHRSEEGQWLVDDEWFKHRLINDPGMILQTRDISTLLSGSYVLKVTALRKNKELIFTRKVEFERSNPFWDRLMVLKFESPGEEDFFRSLSSDSVHYYLRALNVILPSIERDNLAKVDHMANKNAGKMYLYRFWKDRFKDDCVAQFKKFQSNVRYADQQFVSGFRYGFESDRGMIYLKYGKPQEVIHEENDNGAYPYEIWYYAKMPTGQTNARFIFYNKDKVGANFVLLHTNTYGERHNDRWEIELYRQVQDEFEGDNPVDAKKMKANINRRAREYFDR